MRVLNPVEAFRQRLALRAVQLAVALTGRQAMIILTEEQHLQMLGQAAAEGFAQGSRQTQTPKRPVVGEA